MALGACSQSTPAERTSTTTTSTTSSSSTTTTAPASSETTVTSETPSTTAETSSTTDEQLHEDHDDASTAPPTWDRVSRASAKTSAEQILGLFARPDLTQAVWWRDLAPRLTDNARRAYSHVDPSMVPVSTVREGTARLTEEESPYLADVEVATDQGTYRVLLQRTHATDRWRAERIEPLR